MKRIIRQGDTVYLDALDRLGRDYDGIIREWKEITREMGADIVVLENETIFDWIRSVQRVPKRYPLLIKKGATK